ncbi:MAG TPA: hypothetical protein PK156_44170 [Polyangium sp.]|nr:hypothetical protein [Polyangium sp.]
MSENVEKKDDAQDAAAAAEAAPAKKDKPAAKASGTAKAGSSTKTKSAAKKTTDEPQQPKPIKAAARRAPPPTTASLGKSITLFVVVVGVLAAGFAVLGQDRSGAARGPSWKVGQTVDIEITTTAADKRELSCASTEEINGRHCANETPTKPWSKDTSQDDKKTFRPYTSTDNIQFIAAGLWSEPVLAGNLPASRFSVKCKYTVEGKLKAPTFHWETGWEGQPRGEMFAGILSNCVIAP